MWRQLGLTLTPVPGAQLRFELAQAADALQFASDPGAPAVRRQADFVETAWAALAQEPGEPVPLGEQVTSTPLLPLHDCNLVVCMFCSRPPTHLTLMLSRYRRVVLFVAEVLPASALRKL